MRQLLNPKVIFEDEQLMVIDKPSGLVVNRAKTVRRETLQDWLESNIKYQISNIKNNKYKEFINRSGLVHRLDKETSGLMVIAKTPKVLFDLQRQFKERTVVKKYFALLHGKVTPSKGDIKAPIKRNPRNRVKFGVFVDGRSAITNYKVLRYYQNPKEKNKSKKYFSLVEVETKTGRTHQIRVHFAHLGHPVVSDPLYAGEKTLLADRHWCPRLFLHAAYLEFTHPTSGESMKFSSELAKDLQSALANLQKTAGERGAIQQAIA